LEFLINIVIIVDKLVYFKDGCMNVKLGYLISFKGVLKNYQEIKLKSMKK